MPSTVNAAFAVFLRDTVNLDPQVTKSARASRDWLAGQIHAFPETFDDFPALYTDKDIAFGSFARNTKIRELDDIDLMFCLRGNGATYTDYGEYIQVFAPKSTGPLHSYCNDNSDILNSRKIINKFVSCLEEVPNYQKADIKRTLEAATLRLTSYTWNFDIVPCFFTTPEWDGRTYYIIPDGQGNWKKTDPRKDRDAVTATNLLHDGNIFNPIRCIKFWNKRPVAPAIPSYLLETILITYYQSRVDPKAYSFADLEIPFLLIHIANSILGPVSDIKRIQGNLNNLALEEKIKINNRAEKDYLRALEAGKAESDGDHETSIRGWREVFGSSFPAYD